MLTPAILALATEVLRLINNLLEARPPEQRQAEALAWFGMWWPLTKRFIRDKDVVKQVDETMAQVTAPQPKTKG